MEKDFLLYLIYSAFIEIRIHAYENNDEKSIELCNLLHTVPLILIAEETGKEAYVKLLGKVENMAMDGWLNMRKDEFYQRYPQYKKNNI